MLAGQAPVGAGPGVPRAVEFQQKVPPTPLDDLVIRGDGPSWWSSITAFDLLATALGDFVVAAWEHALTPQFDFGRDYLGFICGQTSGDDWTSLLELIETVRNDTPERMAERIAIPGNFNATDRQLWEAFKCPQALATQHGLNHTASPATLLSRLVPLHLDFRSADSSAEAQARSWCEAALSTGHAARANDLYNAVLQLVARTRPSGGSITWARAQRELGAEFALARRADAAPDWAVLEQHTTERVNAVRDVLVDDLHLPRASAHAQLAGVAAATFIFLTGPSGCGKTALAKAWLRSAPSQLWLSPRDLGDGLLGFGNRLGLRFGLADVLELDQAPIRVVVDGLDRSYDPAAHAAGTALASAAAESGGALQVLVTSQSFAVGRVRPGRPQATDPEHPPDALRIGSMNKMFTAVAILQLVEAGKVKLTAPVGTYLPDYPNRQVATKVTIHQLLTHTGGTGDIFGPAFDAHRNKLRTLADYVKLYGKRGLEFEPGSQWAYSNYGFILLGVVIERVTGQSYYDYVQQHIYAPAGMTRSGSLPENQAVPGRSIGYSKPPATTAWVPNTDTLPYRGTSAGGGYSTVEDLARFARALLSHKLLVPDATKLLITGKVKARPGARYAYGFEDARNADGNGWVGHGGGAPGINGDLRIYPKSGYVVAVLANLDPPAAQRISEYLDPRLPTAR